MGQEASGQYRSASQPNGAGRGDSADECVDRPDAFDMLSVFFCDFDGVDAHLVPRVVAVVRVITRPVGAVVVQAELEREVAGSIPYASAQSSLSSSTVMLTLYRVLISSSSSRPLQ